MYYMLSLLGRCISSSCIFNSTMYIGILSMQLDLSMYEIVSGCTFDMSVHLLLCRFWRAYGALFNSISESRPDVRAVVISSAFQDIFSAGFDRMFFNFSGAQRLLIP